MKPGHDTSRLTGYLCAIGATVFWSGNFIVARDLSTEVPPVSLAFWRWCVAVAVLLPIAGRSLVAHRRVIADNLGYLSVTAFLGVTVFNTLVYIGGRTTSALNLSLISITAPVFIVILARVFNGEPFTARKGAGILLVSVGVVMLITRGNPALLLGLSFTAGDLWMLAGAVVWAGYSILVLKKPRELGNRAFQLSTFMLGLLFLLPFYLWERQGAGLVVLDERAIYSILYLGVFASLVSFALWNRAILLVGASRAGMVYYTLPLFSGVLAWLFIGERIGVLHLVSGMLIVSGILIANRGRGR